MNIYLIGYRCTGKSSVGHRLAEKLGCKFVDADRLVERQAGMPVSDIVARFGWPDFRKREKEVIAELSWSNQLVVATGGGVVLDPENVRILRKTGFVVWLKATVETIYARMRQDPVTGTLRPALTDWSLADEIRHTLDERLPLYERARDIEMETDGIDVDPICTHIIEKMRSFHAR